MRQITADACHALENGRDFRQSNTVVKNGSMYLWGNEIAQIASGQLYVTLSGYNTVTTRERLNGLHGVSVYSRNYQPYINGVAVDSNKWYRVTDNGVVEVQ